ncbi:hypothetical protein HDU86_000426 [Geranomyces michiganensis]|nr:hypothetical protein HDU86_000426 [Geranomyces michiganensis]
MSRQTLAQPPPPTPPPRLPRRPPAPQAQPTTAGGGSGGGAALALLLLLASSPTVLAQAISCRQAANVCIQNSTATATVPFELFTYSGNFAGANIPSNPKQWDVRMYAGDLGQDRTPFTNPCAPPSSALIQTWPGDSLDWEASTPSISKVSLTIANSDALRAALAGGAAAEQQGFFFSVGQVSGGQCTLGPYITPYNQLRVVLPPPPASSSSSHAASSTMSAAVASPTPAIAGTSTSNAPNPIAATPAPPPESVAIAPPPPSSSSSSTPVGTIAGIAAGAVALIALILAFLLHRRSRSRKAWGLENGSRSIGISRGGIAAGAGAASAAAAASKRNPTSENASLARLVNHGSEGQSLRATTPDGGAMSPDEIRVGSFGSRASFERRNNAEAVSLARSGSINNSGRSYLLPAAAALAGAAASSAGSSTHDDVSDASPRSSNPFLDPPAAAAATTTTTTAGQSKNRGSIMATMNQPYRSLPRPSTSDSLSSTEDQDPTNPFIPILEEPGHHKELLAPAAADAAAEGPGSSENPFATAGETTGGDHRHRMAQLIANAYRKGLSDEQTHWHSGGAAHHHTAVSGIAGSGSGVDAAKEVPGLRRVDDGRHASAATLSGLDQV